MTFLLIPILPILLGLIILLFGFLIGRKGTIILICSLFFFLIITLICQLEYKIIAIELFNWFSISNFQAIWKFKFDSISLLMSFLILTVSFCVYFYSISYLAAEPHFIRFSSYYVLFVGGMLILIFSANFLVLFMGWELIGLMSYCLINFWFIRIKANQAAINAVLINKIGDIAMLLAISLIYCLYQTVDFNVIFSLISITQTNITWVCLFLLISTVAKSAQLGLHSWLPLAMEGATSVSALLHSATMVTSGVFLLIRTSFLFEYANSILVGIILIGSITSFVASLIGLTQNDYKSCIAYSTLSQLGYMITACGVSQYSTAFFHLLGHGFFKSLLFLSAGSVIHALDNEQDIRKMGRMAKIIPLTYCFSLLGSFSLIGLPFFTGFFTKDLILENLISYFSIPSIFSYVFCLITVSVTGFYSIRLLWLTFHSENRIKKPVLKKIHESNFFMLISMLILTFFAVFFGFFIKELFGIGTTFFNTSIYISWTLSNSIDFEFIPLFIKLFPLILLVVSTHIFFCIKNITINFSNKWSRWWYLLSANKFYFEILINKLIINHLIIWSYYFFFVLIEKGIFEFFGPTGNSKWITVFSNNITQNSTGIIYDYLFYLFIAFIFVLTFFLKNEINLLSFVFMNLDRTFFFKRSILIFLKKFYRLIISIATNLFDYFITIFSSEWLMFLILIKNCLIFYSHSLLDLIGVDFINNNYRFQLNLVINNLNLNNRCIIKVIIQENQNLQSLLKVFKNSNWYERYCYEFFGILFKKNTDLRRLITDYSFNYFPLKKNFPLTGFEEIRYNSSLASICHERLELAQIRPLHFYVKNWF